MATKRKYAPEASICLNKNNQPCTIDKAVFRIKLKKIDDDKYNAKLLKACDSVTGFTLIHQEVLNYGESPRHVLDNYLATIDEKQALEEMLLEAFPSSSLKHSKKNIDASFLNSDGKIKK